MYTMADSTPIMFMPCEVIEYIFKNKDIRFIDILNFSLTCKQFRKIIEDGNNLWRRKFFQRWPSLREPYKEYQQQFGYVSNWLLEITSHMQTWAKLLSEISDLCTKSRGKDQFANSELRYLDPLFCPEEGGHQMAYKFLTMQLIDMVSEHESITKLTRNYYSKKVLIYMTERHVRNEWKAFISLPAEKQLMEHGAVLLAQWGQPMKVIDHKHMSVQFDLLANEVKELLRSNHPEHPIFSVPAKWFNVWKQTILEDNQWSHCDSYRILEAVCEVIFTRHNFDGKPHLHYKEHSSFINCVFERKRGTAVALAVLFEAVARRLGVKCEPINFPMHFLLRWKERYDIPDSADTEIFYVDLYNKGRFVTKDSCPRIGTRGVRCPIEKFNVQSAATAVEVVQRLACSYETAARQPYCPIRPVKLRSALELRHLIEPKDTNVISQLCHYYMLHKVEVVDLVRDLEDISRDLEPYGQGRVSHMLRLLHAYEVEQRQFVRNEVKIRNEQIQFAVGIIMLHEPSMLRGVIVGWDYEYDDYTRWKEPDGGPPPSRRRQPFYNVLFMDGSAYYVAQENLVLPRITCQPMTISHYEVGRYFEEFNGIYYVPNKMTANRYPQDAEACDTLLGSAQLMCGPL